MSEDVYKHDVLAWAIQLLEPNEEVKEFISTKNLYDKYETQSINFEHTYTRIGDSIRFHGKSMISFIRCCEMLTITKGKTKTIPTFWAHNGAKFDGKFILDYYLNDQCAPLAGVTYDEVFEDNNFVQRKFTYRKSALMLTMVGTRALKIQINNMTWKCSLAHLAGSLRSLPAMFNLETQTKKGEFPYGRLKTENWGQKLPYPTIDEFDLESKTKERKEEIEQWYAEQDTTQLWDFDKELWEYLFADVDVLSKVLAAYDEKAKELQQPLVQRNRTQDTAGEWNMSEDAYISPLDSATSPSFSLLIYRTWFLPKDTIAILKPSEEKLVRESLHGGRTDKRCNWVKVEQEGDSIQYEDFKSLYPSVQKTNVHNTYYPVGIPSWGRWNGPTNNRQLKQQMSNKCGFLRVDTTHNKYTTHPTLSRLGADKIAEDDKLLFENKNHEKEVYAWPELEEAIRCGEIEVTHVYDALLFDKGSVFDGYVDFFFKVKDDAERDGNGGLRSLAKLLLNSLWGKLGQKSYPVREWIEDAARRDYLWNKFTSKEYELISVVDKSEQRVHVTYRIKEDIKNLNDTACHVAAYVSMWGRVQLHKKVLSVHGQRALYCDTDSGVIYLRAGETVPFKGNGLGQLTSEISKIVKDKGFTAESFPNPRITEAVFVVPKTYGLKLESSNGQTTTKVVCKGFEVSYANAQTVTFQAMKDLVFTQYGINAFLNGKRIQEEDIAESTFIPGAKRLTFRSAIEGVIAPQETTVKKGMRGGYTKGKVHPHDPRFIIPFGTFEPQSETFLNKRSRECRNCRSAASEPCDSDCGKAPHVE